MRLISIPTMSMLEKRYIPLVLWSIFFCYSIIAALIFQKIILPMFPAFHGGSGLISNDSMMYHNVAIHMAESIKQYGWGVWTIWPQSGITGNIAILGALYVIFGYDPTIVIPINAVLHATSALLLFRMGSILWPGRVGLCSGLIAGTLFVIFPSSLNWYAQINKDGYVILGTLCILYAWIKGIAVQQRLKSVLWILCGTFCGVMCVIFTRPYNVKILVAAGIFIFSLIVIFLSITSQIKSKCHLVFSFLLVLLMFIFTSSYVPKASLEDKELFTPAELEWKWKKSDLMPERVDKTAETAATIRAYNILNGRNVGARSMIDEDQQPANTFSVLAYMPRALQIATLAPFPSKWFEHISVIRMVSVLETIIWYLFIPGIFICFYRKRSLSLYVIVVFSLFFLGIYGFTLPNVGTLYRMRYVYIFILMLVGAIGWVSLISSKESSTSL
jgi:putative peptidoglycan lipid II flippase